MKTPTPPPAPDPAATIKAQSESNINTAVAQTGLNAQNQYTPYGSLEYSEEGTWEDGTPRFSATQSLNQAQQGLLDQQNKFGGLVNQLGIAQTERLQGHLDTPVDFSSTAIDRNIMDRYRPRFEEDTAKYRSDLEASLVNKGFRIGAEGYSRAVNEFEDNRGDSWNNLNIGARGQALNEMALARNQPINEITALMSGGQVTNPNFVSTPQTGIGDTDVAGITQAGYANSLVPYRADLANRQALYSGIASIGSAAAGGWAMSDVRVKEDIKKVGELDSGLGIYKFRYMGTPLQQLGVMAQEVEQIQPEAVAETESGYKAVNYDAVIEAA